MSIRWRLTLWFSLILCVCFILSGVIIHSLLLRSLRNEVDANLRFYSARVAAAFQSDAIQNPMDYDLACAIICSCLPTPEEFAPPGIYVQLLDGNGSVVGKSDNLGEQRLPVDASTMQRGFEGEVSVRAMDVGDGGSVRVMASPLYLPEGTFLLEVGQSAEHIDDIMSRVRWSMLAGILAALALAGISGGILVRRALSPVEVISKTAQKVESSSDLSQRVGYSGPMDEIGRLAATFDRMIEHLDRVFQSQKHFVADASHELRTPLTVIQGNLDLLKRHLSERERLESLRTIEREREKMAKIVSDLLLLAEIESGQIEWQEKVSLKEILLEALKRAQRLAENCRIEIGRQEDLHMRGDAYRLTQLLGNLVDNAIRYTPEGGTITLSLFRVGDWACLQVTDSGVGISPEHLPHIFDRFYRVDQARSRANGASGLGLAIVKGIAEQHGGRVTVESEMGKGSTFTVWLKL